MAHLLRKKIPAADPHQELLQEISTAAQRLDTIVKEIEIFSRLPEVCLAPADLLAVLEETLAALAPRLASSGITVSFQAPGELPPIPLDVRLMGQVFRILVENALEAMSLGGALTITVALEPRLVRITIQDTGPGIPAESLPLVFDPFFSTKPQGTGMGLTIAHRIISEHQGEIRLSSAPGAGVTVDLCLPRWPSD
jgi:signal transduction histidine kinase